MKLRYNAPAEAIRTFGRVFVCISSRSVQAGLAGGLLCSKSIERKGM